MYKKAKKLMIIVLVILLTPLSLSGSAQQLSSQARDVPRLNLPGSREGLSAPDSYWDLIQNNSSPSARWTHGITLFNETWIYKPDLPVLIPGSFFPKVYVIVYDPLLSNGKNLIEHMQWSDPAQITQDTINFFNDTSHGQVQYKLVGTEYVEDGWPELIDGFQYSETTYFQVLSDPDQAHYPTNVNYNSIIDRFDLCGKSNRREIDEVWVFNGPWFGFWESTLAGPNAYFYNSPPVMGTICERLLPIMGPSPERSIQEAIENFGHRTESTMYRVYGEWDYGNGVNNNWEKFALVKAHVPSYSYSGCGNIHFPPNGVQDYDWGNTELVLTNCDDFNNYPYLSDPPNILKEVSCTEWGCNGLGYFDYWFRHLPANPGCGPDNVSNNWWNYFANPTLAKTPLEACQNTLEVFLNHSEARSGSTLTLRGVGFPSNLPTKISINGIEIYTGISTDLFGNFVALLNTDNLQSGRYNLEVDVNPRVQVSFIIGSQFPFFGPEGSSPNYITTPVINPLVEIFLPLITR
jgi:hypothetical protein